MSRRKQSMLDRMRAANAATVQALHQETAALEGVRADLRGPQTEAFAIAEEGSPADERFGEAAKESKPC